MHQLLHFLALIDSVSGAHGMGSLSVVSIRTCVSEPITCISFKFQLQLALGLNQGGKWHVWNKIMFSVFLCEFFNFSLTLYPTEANISKRHSSLKYLLNCFKPFLNFLPSGCHKSIVLHFNLKFFSFWFLTIFLNHHCIVWEYQILNYLENWSFPIIDYLVSRKRLVVERNGVKFGAIWYFWQLSA